MNLPPISPLSIRDYHLPQDTPKITSLEALVNPPSLEYRIAHTFTPKIPILLEKESKELTAFTAKLLSVTSLDLEGTQHITQIALKYLILIPHIKHLSLGSCGLVDAHSLIFSATKLWLETLDLSNNPHFSGIALQHPLRALPKLTALDLSENPCITDDLLSKLLSYLSQLKKNLFE